MRQPSVQAPNRANRPEVLAAAIAAGAARWLLNSACLRALSHFDPTDLFDALATGIIVLDAQLCPIYANVAAQDLLAFSLNQARGRPFGDFLHDTNGLVSTLRRALDTGQGISDRELTVRPIGSPRETRVLDITSRRSKARSPARICCSS